MRKSPYFPIPAFFAASMLFFSFSSRAEVLRVDPEGTAAKADCEDATPHKGLQACLDRARANGEPDAIELAPGRYVGRFHYLDSCEAEVLDCQESLQLVGIDRPVLDPGNFDPALPALSIEYENGAPGLVVRGIDFDGGESGDEIRGIEVRLKENDFELSDCEFRSFKANGAAMVGRGGGNRVAILGNRFLGNGGGGGGVGGGGMALVLNDSSETEITAIDFSNNLVAGNKAEDIGGGVLVVASRADFVAANNIFHANLAFRPDSVAGGIYLELRGVESSASLVHNTIAGNSADGIGGGIFFQSDGGSGDLFNNIVFGNVSRDRGADILLQEVFGQTDKASSFELFANIFGDLAVECEGDCLSEGGNILDVALAGDLFVDPDSDLRLKESSPAIDAGDPAAPGIPEADFEGNARDDGAPDLGALEFKSTAAETPDPSEGPEAPSESGGGCSLGSAPGRFRGIHGMWIALGGIFSAVAARKSARRDA